MCTLNKVFLALLLVLAIGRQSKQELNLTPAVKSENVTSQISSGLTRTLSDFYLLIHDILNNFSSSPLRDDTLLLLRKTVTKLTKSLEIFSARMLNAAEEVTRNIFISLKQKLNNLEAEFKDISRLTDEEFIRVINYVNNTIMEESQNMDSWAKNLKLQLRSMNDTTLYRKLCPAIDGLIKETTNELSGCCNIVIKPVKSICRNVKAILRETFQVVADVVETVDNCIFSEDNFDSMVISCLEDIYDDVSALMDRAAALRHTLMTKLPTKILLSNFCITLVSVQMASRKTSVEQQIEFEYFNN